MYSANWIHSPYLIVFFYSFALLRHRRSPEISVAVFLRARIIILPESPRKMAVR